MKVCQLKYLIKKKKKLLNTYFGRGYGRVQEDTVMENFGGHQLK